MKIGTHIDINISYHNMLSEYGYSYQLLSYSCLKCDTSNITGIQILTYYHEIWYVNSWVNIIQYFNVNIHISGILII
jgi:hypothetical protein